MKRTWTCVLLGLAGCLAAGCFDIEQSLTLERDLSGKAGFSMSINMEPMVLFMLQFQRQMAGKTGDATPAEIAQAKQEFLAQKKEKGGGDKMEAQKAELVKSLPPGIRLLDSKVEDEGLKMKARLSFAFDNVDKLRLIQLPKEKDAKPGAGNPFEEPFAGLQIVDEGKTLLLTSRTVNPLPTPESTGRPALAPDMKKAVEGAFQGFKLAWKIATPFEVVETNATRREGKTLYWEYDLPAIEKMSKEQAAIGIRARFRK